MSTQDLPPTRRPGAPSGNLNALKHGLYSRIFRESEHEQVQEIVEQDVAQEIDLLRVIIKRTAERAEEAHSFDAQLRFLSVLSQATAQLTRLLKVQKSYRAAQSSKEFDESLDQLEAAVRTSLLKRFATPNARHPAPNKRAPDLSQADLRHRDPTPAEPTPYQAELDLSQADLRHRDLTPAEEPIPADETGEDTENKFWLTYLDSEQDTDDSQ